MVLETKVISYEPQYYHGWPTLTRRHNGELLVAYSGGREAHICPFGRVELMVSHDNGGSWGWSQVVLDSAMDARDAGVLETAQGRLLVTTFTSLAYERDLLAAETKAGSAGAWTDEKLKTWRAAHNRLSAAQREAGFGQWMVRSSDGGTTWSARYPSIVSSPHGPIQLSAGRLIAHIRNENQAGCGETLQSESSDGGGTWSVPHSIGVWGLPSFLLRLHDGWLLMTYGHRRAPLGNQARLSTNHNRTWSAPMIISGDGDLGDLGYPSTVEFDDGSLLTVWYEQLKTSPYAVLRQAHWQLDG